MNINITFVAVMTLMLSVLVHPHEIAQSSQLRGEPAEYNDEEVQWWDDDSGDDDNCSWQRVCSDWGCDWMWLCSNRADQERLDNEKDGDIDGKISHYLRSATSY